MPRTPLPYHQAQCTICPHPKRHAIEREFVNWVSPRTIARDFQVSRDGVYRHGVATGLIAKRQQNIRAALEKIIEHAGDVKVNAYAVVQAISAYARINARGQWVQRNETVNLNKLFDRMTGDELERYAQSGELPEGFPRTGVEVSESAEGSEAEANLNPDEAEWANGVYPGRYAR